MRYAKIYADMWHDEKVMALDLEARELYIYLLSCEHCNNIGFFRLPIGYMAIDLRRPQQKIEKSISSLVKDGLIEYDAKTGAVLIPKFLKWNSLGTELHYKGAANEYNRLLDSPLDAEFIACVKEYCKGMARYLTRNTNATRMACPCHSNAIPMPLESDGNGIIDSYQEHEQEQQQEQEQEKSSPEQPKTSDSGLPPELPVFSLPRRDGTECMFFEKQLKDYSEAFPALDIMGELRRMKIWLQAHPKNAKTDIPSFVNRWLAKGQDRGSPSPRGFPSDKPSQRELGNEARWEEYLHGNQPKEG